MPAEVGADTTGPYEVNLRSRPRGELPTGNGMRWCPALREENLRRLRRAFRLAWTSVRSLRESDERRARFLSVVCVSLGTESDLQLDELRGERYLATADQQSGPSASSSCTRRTGAMPARSSQ